MVRATSPEGFNSGGKVRMRDRAHTNRAAKGFVMMAALLLSSCAGDGPIGQPEAAVTVTVTASPEEPTTTPDSSSAEPENATESSPAASPTPETEDSAQDEPSSESASAAVEADCPPGVKLPSGMSSRYCGEIPDDAKNGGRGERFVSPSGNVACVMGEEYASCQARENPMIADTHNPEGDGVYDGYGLKDTAELMCHSVPVYWEKEGDHPSSWDTLSYGDTVFVYDFVCESSQEGMTCWKRSQYLDW